MIITISREYGCGGGEVASRVAESLGWRVVDNELVAQIAARSGLTPAEVVLREERAPGFFERLARLLSKAVPEMFHAAPDKVPELEEAKLVKITETVVAEIAREGRVVLVGRAAPVVLSQSTDALHLKIVAPKAVRVATIAKRTGLSEEDAEAEVDSYDGNRNRYHQDYYGRDWRDASNYHLVLNSAALGLEETVATIVGRAWTLWPGETRERRRGQGPDEAKP
jgi:cytidylate kinase